MIRAVLIGGLIASAVGLTSSVAASAPVWCHQVRLGDTLSGIAHRYGMSVRRLLELNALQRSSKLLAGTILALPRQSLRAGRLRLQPASLAASRGNLRHENAAADREGLTRFRTHREIQRFVRRGLLVPLPAQTGTYWVESVPPPLRVARPWARRFIDQLAQGFNALFGGRLKLTSLTRTVEVQRFLDRINENAAPAHGPSRSTHLTGASVDISKQQLGPYETLWLRTVLERLRTRSILHAIEEFRQPHFHIMIFRAYLDYAKVLPSPLLIGGC